MKGECVPIVIDIILILLVLAGSLWGIKVGFVGLISKPFKILSSIFLAYSCSEILSKKLVFPLLFDLTSEKLNELIFDKLNSESNLRVYLSSWIDELNIFASSDLGEGPDFSYSSEVSGFVNRLIIDPILSSVSVIISFVLLYIFFRMFLYLIFCLLVRLTNKGMIGVVNKAFGFAVAFIVIFSFNCFLARLTNRIINIDILKDAAWAHSFEGGRVFTFFKEMSPLDLLLNINF